MLKSDCILFFVDSGSSFLKKFVNISFRVTLGAFPGHSTGNFLQKAHNNL